jgi:hypothetical protein
MKVNLGHEGRTPAIDIIVDAADGLVYAFANAPKPVAAGSYAHLKLTLDAARELIKAIEAAHPDHVDITVTRAPDGS